MQHLPPQIQGGGRRLDVDGQGGGGGERGSKLGNFMDVICVSWLRSSFEIAMQAYQTDRFLSKNDAEIAAVLKMMFVS